MFLPISYYRVAYQFVTDCVEFKTTGPKALPATGDDRNEFRINPRLSDDFDLLFLN